MKSALGAYLIVLAIFLLSGAGAHADTLCMKMNGGYFFESRGTNPGALYPCPPPGVMPTDSNGNPMRNDFVYEDGTRAPSPGTAQSTTQPTTQFAADWHTWPRGPQDAAWCIWKDGNRRINQKSQRDGNCANYFLTPYAWVTEHQLGEAAVALACGQDVLPILGIAIPDESALFPLLVCQCHNFESQSLITNNSAAVLQSLRQIGGCQ